MLGSERKPEPIQSPASYNRLGSACIAATTSRRKHADGLNVRQEAALHQHLSPSWLYKVKQILQCSLVLLRVAGMDGIKHFKGVHHCPSFWSHPRIDRLGREEAWTCYILNNRVAWLREVTQRHIQAGDSGWNEGIDDVP